ncbi:MAG: 2,3,4,5-tetrahydropyridine-2,6-dicarboxylate N-succinyltransferase [Bdellovibrio sp.]|nr:2,3,4,5-tetrahydropyridine-2,6-dicarboxylate N-succinyltransferase [Bdellovibrio sp.]
MKDQINQLFDNVAKPDYVITAADTEAVQSVIHDIDFGKIRVCEKTSTGWVTNDWVKKAILLYFKVQKMQLIETEHWNFFDKIPLKKWNGSEGVRVVPQALVRVGSFVEKGAILMPSYINIGAYVGANTMVDTWATVGSCAQIGANVHLSGGVGIGGVLEPAQAQPVIIEDDCFLGSRCIVVEGVHLEQGVVLGAGVILTASTKIIDVTVPNAPAIKGRVPANSVVIPGVQNKTFAGGTFGVPCALIIGQRQESTNKKTSLNQALRDFEVSV